MSGTEVRLQAYDRMPYDMPSDGIQKWFVPLYAGLACSLGSDVLGFGVWVAFGGFGGFDCFSALAGFAGASLTTVISETGA